ncbi:MAG: DUF3427 domain-containing protein [Planctomycetota bacterium]|nr:MAG: DUF3427 domain-containing protein [Planctomycetota bacterium]
MNELPNGWYESLIDGTLAQALVGLSDQERHALTLDLEPASQGEVRREAVVAAFSRLLAKALDDEDMEGSDQELALLSRVLAAIRQGRCDNDLPRPLRLLRGVVDPAQSAAVEPPRTGLRQPWLFTSGRHDPSLLDELRRELSCVDEVNILVSFITWSGVRKIQDLIRQATAVGGDGRSPTRLRILTTTYIGATEARAVHWLAEQPGVELRISLDGRRTRLHAKAWIFRRATGFGTAYVGSANLSGAALTGGLEWTVKTTQAGAPELFQTATAHFETLWDDPEFTAYDPNKDEHRLALHDALRRERGHSPGNNDDDNRITFFALQPKAYQYGLLERLAAERRHGRTRNLLVAATGTGKTVIAAFDYLASCHQQGGRPRLLFIAHRKEILQQARATFIQVLRQPGFGSICADGHIPETFDHCFCTVQSFASQALADRFAPDYWHSVIIDECHHMTAASYQALAQLRPAILLGLTATPERADGARLDSFFDMRLDGGPAAELRLWEALDQQLLAPFEYYGIDDGDTDLSSVQWGQRRREEQQLNAIVNGNHARARLIMAAVDQYVSNPQRMKALAFCVSVEHAHFMAEAFTQHGLQAMVVVGSTDAQLRRQAPAQLARGEIQVICTCDLYNEGIDIPDVDTLLILRPTHSPVLIQQQLGRGLRLAPGKESCLILDLVGRHNTDFRFDRLLGLLSGLSRSELASAAKLGFSTLPPGCHIHLDHLTREQVLRNLRELSISSWRHLIVETQAWLQQATHRRQAGLAEFLRDTGIELAELYRGGNKNTARGWAALRRACGIESRPEGDDEARVSQRIASNLLNQDDPALLASLKRVADPQERYNALPEAERRRQDALSAELYPGREDPVSGSQLTSRLADAPALREELGHIAEILSDETMASEQPVPDLPESWPLCLHCGYSLRSLMILTGKIAANSRHLPQAGIVLFPQLKTEFLLVTLDKSSGFTARTSYHDYAMSPERFHWQTQNGAGPNTTAGQRYLHGAADGWVFQLFVRETKNHLYRALGPVVYDGHEGAEPMSITWNMKVPIPLNWFRKYSVLREG